MAVNKSAMQLAYMQVNSITKKTEVTKEPHKTIIDTALQKVATYDGLFAGEDDVMREKRLEIEGPENGEVAEIVQYFKDLYPDDFRGVSSWVIIYTMYNRMNESTVNEVEKDEEETVDSSDNKNNMIEEREDNVMANEAVVSEVKEEMNAQLKELEQQLSGGLGADISQEALPKGPDAVLKSVAYEKTKDQKDSRIAYSENSLIENVILSTPGAAERVVDVKNPVGKISKPDKILKIITEKFGVNENLTTGEVTFENCPQTAENLKNAEAMYKIVKEAATVDKDRTMEAYIGKNIGALKGVYFRDPDKNVTVKDISNLKDVMIKKACGYIPSAVPGCDFQIGTVKASTSRAKAGTGTSKSSNKSKDSYKGIASLRVANRTEAFTNGDFVKYHKPVDKSAQEEKSGIRSALKVEYYGKVDQNGKRKICTYRVPLLVNQYKTEVVDEQLRKVFGDGAGVGQGITAIDKNNADSIKNMLNSLSAVIASATDAGVAGFEDYKSAAEQEASKDQAASTEAFEEAFAN